jgi:hypothetical protein
MAGDKNPSALTAAGTPDGTEAWHVVQAGNSRKMTLSQALGKQHNHAISDVTGLQTALDAKLDDSQAGAGGLAVLGAADAAAARAAAGASTVGGNIFALTDPSSITFLRLNADNTVSALAAAAFRTAIGAGVGGGDLVSTNNLSDVASAATARTNLGATTVGANLFGLSNPGAITFLRVNADNSVTALSASAFRTAIGAGDMLAANNLSDVASKVAAKDTISVKGADIASAATTDLSAATGDFVYITGTTTITALGTCAAGVERTVKFAGALTLTHNATSLILPTAANITTAAKDVARFRSIGSGNWLCVGYMKANGQALIGSGTTIIPGSFSKWQTAKARGSTAPARMAFIGDSNVVGEGSGSGTRGLTGAIATSPARALATLLGYRTDHFFGDQNVTIAPTPVNYNTYDSRVTLGTGWAPDAGAPNTLGGRFFIAPGGSAGKLRFTPANNVTKFRFWYPVTGSLNSAFTVGVDGTTVDTFSEAGTNAYLDREYSVTSGAHYIELGVGATGSGYVGGVETFDGTATPSLLQLGQCGVIASNLNDNSNPWSPKQALALLAPDYAIVYCTIVDTESATSLSSYIADMEGLVATLSATADGCLVVGFPSSGVGTTNGYLNEMAILLRNLAQDYGWSFIDLRPQLGHSNTRAGTLGVKYDTKHPNAAGATAIANQLYAVLSSGLN